MTNKHEVAKVLYVVNGIDLETLSSFRQAMSRDGVMFTGPFRPSGDLISPKFSPKISTDLSHDARRPADARHFKIPNEKRPKQE